MSTTRNSTTALSNTLWTWSRRALVFLCLMFVLLLWIPTYKSEREPPPARTGLRLAESAIALLISAVILPGSRRLRLGHLTVTAALVATAAILQHAGIIPVWL